MTEYADRIGRMKIENTPPDGLRTIEWWIDHAKITSHDRVLDLACSTGFSSRNTSRLTGASAEGIDLSEPSVEAARSLAQRDRLGDLCKFHIGDAECIEFPDLDFSVALVGTVFAFFQNKARALSECRRVLKPRGRLCVATFYFHATPPEGLLKDVAAQLGFQPDPSGTYDHWRRFFETQFKLTSEKTLRLPVLTRSQLEQYVTDMLVSLPQQKRVRGSAEFDEVFAIRHNLNELRTFQGVATWVFEKI